MRTTLGIASYQQVLILRTTSAGSGEADGKREWMGSNPRSKHVPPEQLPTQEASTRRANPNKRHRSSEPVMVNIGRQRQKQVTKELV